MLSLLDWKQPIYQNMNFFQSFTSLNVITMKRCRHGTILSISEILTTHDFTISIAIFRKSLITVSRIVHIFGPIEEILPDLKKMIFNSFPICIRLFLRSFYMGFFSKFLLQFQSHGLFPGIMF